MSASKTKTKKVLDMKFMIPTLQNILKWTWKREVNIRGPVQDVLDIIEKRVTGKPLKMQDCFHAMILGCKYKKDKVQLACLHCMEEMVKRSFLKFCKKSLSAVIAAVSDCKKTNNEDIQFAVLKVVREIAIGAGFSVHNDDLMNLFGVCSHLAIKSRHSELRIFAKEFMRKIHSHVFAKVESTDESNSKVALHSVYPEVFHILKFDRKLPFTSHHRDALRMFEQLSEMAGQKDTATISLDLLKEALANCTAVMKHHTQFTDSIRTQVCCIMFFLKYFSSLFCIDTFIVAHTYCFLPPPL